MKFFAPAVISLMLINSVYAQQEIACTHSNILDEVENYLSTYRKGHPELGFCLNEELKKIKNYDDKDMKAQRDLVFRIADKAMKLETEATAR